MVVVGGRSSANTKELTRLCEIAGTPAIQIESVRDLTDAAAFDGARVVGVTGGTSTPIEDLRDVAQRILELAGHARGAGARPPSSPTRRSAAPRPRPAGRPRSRTSPRDRPPAPPDAWPARPPAAHAARRRAPDRRHRRPAERRQEHALQPDRRRADRRSSRTGPGRRATACTATPSGTAGGSSLVDTGGLEVDPDDPIEARVQEQARLAIAEADVIVFVVDAVDGPDAGRPRGGRAAAARDRRRSSSPSTRPTTRSASSRRPSSTRSAGSETYPISASHGRGTRRPARRHRLGAAAREPSRSSPARRARPRPTRGPTRSRPAGSSRSSSASPRRATRTATGTATTDADDRGRRRGRRAGTPRSPPRPTRRPPAIAFVGPPERRQVEPAQRAARRGAGDRLGDARARRATRSTRAWRGAAARSCSSTRPASGGAARSRPGPAAERYSTLRALTRAVARRRRGPRDRRRRGADRAGRPRRGLRGRGGQGPRRRRQQVGPRRGEDRQDVRPVHRVDPQRGAVPRLRADRVDQRQDRPARRPRARAGGRHLGRAAPAHPDRRAEPARCMAATERHAAAARPRQAAQALLRDAGGHRAADVRVLRLGRVGRPLLVPALPREPAARDVRVRRDADPARVPRSGLGQAAAAQEGAASAPAKAAAPAERARRTRRSR